MILERQWFNQKVKKLLLKDKNLARKMNDFTKRWKFSQEIKRFCQEVKV